MYMPMVVVKRYGFAIRLVLTLFEHMYLCFLKLVLFTGYSQADVEPVVVLTDADHKFSRLAVVAAVSLVERV